MSDDITTRARELLDDEGGRAEEFAELGVDLSQQPDLGTAREAVTAAAQRTLGGDGGGIFLHERGRLVTAWATDESAERAEHLQNELNEGPCIDSALEPEFRISADLCDEPRWASWSRRMVELGWRSALSAPLLAPGGEPIGSLNLFSPLPSVFSDDLADLAAVFALHASVAVLNARREENLNRAIAAQHRVGVAQGIVMAQFDVDPGRAFELIRAYSQRANIKLAAVASYVIERRGLPGA